MLEFSVSNQTLTRLDETAVVSDSVNYLDCHFTFSPDWEGVTPVATFGHSEVAEPITVMIVDGVCRVPWEVIRPYGFYMAVYGSGKSGEGIFTHIPTDTVTVEVGKSGVAERMAPAAPTPDMYDTLMAEIQAGVAAATQARESALTSKESAQYQASVASNARTAAQAAQQECSVLSARAKDAAEKAEKAAESVSAETALAVSARRELDDALVLSKSYAVGMDRYRNLGGTDSCTWDSGKLSMDYLGLKADHRYRVEINEVWFDGVCHLVETPVPGPGDLAELLSEPGDELTPEIPGGDDTDPIVPDDPTEKYVERMVLQVGPLTFEQWKDETNSGTEVTTTDTVVYRFQVYTDGHDNSKYYMMQAQAARNECASILHQMQELQGG